MSRFFTLVAALFCLWSGSVIALNSGSADMPPNNMDIGALHHGNKDCPEALRNAAIGAGLGDLRVFVSDPDPVFFRAPLPGAADGTELDYESEIHLVSERDSGFQSVVEGLKRRALANGWEQEAGALSFVADGERITVYFSSRSYDRIQARHHRHAMQRFLEKVGSTIDALKARGVSMQDMSIERFHTHPRNVNLPHSAQDILQDWNFDVWLQRSPAFSGIRFRSYVVMLYYEGDVFVEFEPRRHRIF